MLSENLDILIESIQHWQVWVSGILAIVLSATYLSTTLQSRTALISSKDGTNPPLLPYWIPFLGHSIPFLWDTGAFIDTIRQYGNKTPVQVTLGPIKGYFVSGAEFVGATLRAPRNLTPKPLMALVMENMFGTPASAMHIYHGDNSGIAPTPLPNTHVRQELRLYHHQHQAAHRFLTGEALRRMTDRFMRFLSEELHHDTTVSREWLEFPDLYEFWKSRIFHAATKALFGPCLLSLNPNFEQDFWEYVDSTPTLMKSLPRWMVPRAYDARDRVFTAVKTWHRFARVHSDYRKNTPEDPEWDEFWGSAWIKVRQQFCQDTGEMNEDAIAAEDVALLVAANANAILSALWFIIHIYSDPDLDRRLQPEFARAIVSTSSTLETRTGPIEFDVISLATSPLLQSVYAEVLRMRISLLLNRTPAQSDFHFGKWVFRRGRFITLSTQIAAHDAEAWGPERTQGGKKPLDRFWAERFLVPAAEQKDLEAKEFSLDGLSNAWIPYGGGSFMCPGRHFAKQEMMGSVAVFKAYYDLEITDKPVGWIPKPNTKFYGIGAMPPGEKIPFRIRRKVV